MKKLKAIAQASNQMTRLVEDLLLLARIDTTSKTPVVECISIPLDELLEDLVDLLQPQAEAFAHIVVIISNLTSKYAFLNVF